MGEEQVHDTLPDDQLLPEDESQSRIKEERKEELAVAPKSEPATAEVKEKTGDHDSEDSFRPEHVEEELQRLIAEFPPAVDPVPQREVREGATAPEAYLGKLMARMRHEDQQGIVVVQCPQTHLCSTLPYGWSVIGKLVRMKSQ